MHYDITGTKGATRISQCTRRVFEWPLSASDLTMHGTSCLNPIMTCIIWFRHVTKPKFASEVPLHCTHGDSYNAWRVKLKFVLCTVISKKEYSKTQSFTHLAFTMMNLQNFHRYSFPELPQLWNVIILHVISYTIKQTSHLKYNRLST